MACDLKILNGYGTGTIDGTDISGQLNSYANVTAYTAASITIGTPSTGTKETFTAGTEIMIHVSAGNGSSTDTTYLGAYLICKIVSVSGSILNIDKDFTVILPTANFANYQVQAITIAQYKNLTLSTSTITPLAYSITSKYGGILLIKCTDTVTYSGGNISLVDKGIPVASTAYRPLTAQETNGTADTDKYSGWENGSTLRQFLLNSGDGAVMLIAKHFVQSGTASRIGGTTAGAQFTRGNKGGSTIALIAGDMTGFDPSIISKTKNSGQGLGRCYIASNTKLRNDEGLYAYDVISDKTRVMRSLKIKGYGNGSLGDSTNPTVPFNNYAKVTAISNDGKSITYLNKTITGMALIGAGSTVIFHVSKHADSTDMSLLGKFVMANVLSDDGSTLVVDTPVTGIFNYDMSKISKYSCQIISVAQFNNLTLSSQHTATTAWDDTKKIGGIAVVSAKSKIDITGGGIIVEKKGGGTAYASAGLAVIGNAQMCDILPLGQGHGSVLLITPNLTGNTASRIGATYDGSVLGGGTSIPFGNSTPKYLGGGYRGSGSTDSNATVGGSGSKGGYWGSYVNPNALNDGGYGSNGIRAASGSNLDSTGYQGGHILVIADSIAGLNLVNFSSGGASYNGQNGGSGYGGGGSMNANVYGSGGGYNGGGAGYYYPSGGSSGWLFIYCNNWTQDTTGVIAA